MWELSRVKKYFGSFAMESHRSGRIGFEIYPERLKVLKLLTLEHKRPCRRVTEVSEKLTKLHESQWETFRNQTQEQKHTETIEGSSKVS